MFVFLSLPLTYLTLSSSFTSDAVNYAIFTKRQFVLSGVTVILNSSRTSPASQYQLQRHLTPELDLILTATAVVEQIPNEHRSLRGSRTVYFHKAGLPVLCRQAFNDLACGNNVRNFGPEATLCKAHRLHPLKSLDLFFGLSSSRDVPSVMHGRVLTHGTRHLRRSRKK